MEATLEKKIRLPLKDELPLYNIVRIDGTTSPLLGDLRWCTELSELQSSVQSALSTKLYITRYGKPEIED